MNDAASSAPGYPEHWAADVVASDGGVVHLRPILPSDADAIGHLSALLGRERVDLHFQFLVALRRENDFLQLCCLPRKSRRTCADAGGNGSDEIGRGQYL